MHLLCAYQYIQILKVGISKNDLKSSAYLTFSLKTITYSIAEQANKKVIENDKAVNRENQRKRRVKINPTVKQPLYFSAYTTQCF